jgi:hypothetical protein
MRRQSKEAKKFLEKLELCRQVEADPRAVDDNPHLPGLLHGIFLRLCSGNITENAVGGVNGPEKRGW